MEKMKVKQFLHANQFELYEITSNTERHSLQSYNSLVCSVFYDKLDNQRIIKLGRDWDYSKTTSTHVFAFLEEYGDVIFTTNNKRKEIENMIKENKIIYDGDMI